MGDIKCVPFGPIVVAGVSGCGKSTVGHALAKALGHRFADADDFHPPHNIEKMARGEPLDDSDRAPWLSTLNALLREHARLQQGIVLACSALKVRYRNQLADGVQGIRFIHLWAQQEVIAERLARRTHRYMPVSLLASQYAALEPFDSSALSIDVTQSLDAVLTQALGFAQSNRAAA